jgi:hypothetical protein
VCPSRSLVFDDARPVVDDDRLVVDDPPMT